MMAQPRKLEQKAGESRERKRDSERARARERERERAREKKRERARERASERASRLTGSPDGQRERRRLQRLPAAQATTVSATATQTSSERFHTCKFNQTQRALKTQVS